MEEVCVFLFQLFPFFRCIQFIKINKLVFVLHFQKGTSPQTRLAQVNELTIRMIIVVIYAALQRTEREYEHYQLENFHQSPIVRMMKHFYWKMVNIRLCVWIVTNI